MSGSILEGLDWTRRVSVACAPKRSNEVGRHGIWGDRDALAPALALLAQVFFFRFPFFYFLAPFVQKPAGCLIYDRRSFFPLLFSGEWLVHPTNHPSLQSKFFTGLAKMLTPDRSKN